MTPDRVVIVGAGLAGSRCARTLRAEGFEGALTLVGEEPPPPYERPALSKEYAVALADGAELRYDLLLVAAGAEPASDLLCLPAGVPTDTHGRTALPGVYACGDAAAPWHSTLAAHLRLEHWTSASDQAAAVARAILGAQPRVAPSRYFWSDQFGLRLQHMGYPHGWKRVVLVGDAESLAARYLDADERLVAAPLVNRPQAVPQLRRQLANELLAA